MATIENDEFQINKKKYIGNDPINIVWSEEPSEFDLNTIMSSLNFV